MNNFFLRKETLNSYKEYMNRHIQSCKRTESIIHSRKQEFIDSFPENISLLHAISGMYAELAELTDLVHKHVFYGIEINEKDIVEEMGDFLYYWDLLGCYLQKITGCESINDITARDRNREKLAIRYPKGYSNLDSINRKLDNENKAFKDLK